MLVTGGEDGSIKVWAAGTWALLHTLQGHTDDVIDLLVLGTKDLLSCSSDSTVTVWDRASWQCTRVVQIENPGVLVLFRCSLATHDGTCTVTVVTSKSSILTRLYSAWIDPDD